MQEILSKKLATMSSSVRKIFQNCNSERTDPSEGSALNKREFQTLLDKCNVQVSFTISFRCAGLCAASSNLRSLHATVLPSAIDFVYLAPLPRRIDLHRFHFIYFIQMNKDEFEKLFAMVDPDGSGTCSFQEFRETFGSFISGGSQIIRWVRRFPNMLRSIPNPSNAVVN